MAMQPAWEEPGLTPDLRAAYLHLIERRAGLRLADRQIQGLDDAVAQLLTRTAHAGPRELYNALARDASRDLVDSLAAALTVGETHFFRIRPQIQALQRTVLPDIIERRSAERRLGLWSAGCSTGEEAYTLAILLHDALPAHQAWDITLLATDINRHALDTARQAIYGEWSFRDTPDLIRQRYFTAAGKGWRLGESVRRMVRFAPLNLVADALPSPGPHGAGLDLILCRNVTIYFSPEATQGLYRRLADALAPGGWLVLGPSDPAPEQPVALAAVYRPGAVLWRRSMTAAPSPPAARQVRVSGAQRPSRVSRVAPRARQPGPALLAPQPAAVPSLPLDQTRTVVTSGTVSREQAERLVRTLPLEVEGHLLLGMVLLDERSIEPAIESLRRAAFLDADNALAHFGLGQAYLRHGDETRARAAFTHARRILAATADDQAIAGGGDMAACELRYAVDAQLTILGNVSRSW